MHRADVQHAVQEFCYLAFHQLVCCAHTSKRLLELLLPVYLAKQRLAPLSSIAYADLQTDQQELRVFVLVVFVEGRDGREVSQFRVVLRVPALPPVRGPSQIC